MPGETTSAGPPLVLRLSGSRQDASLGRRFIADVLPRLGWEDRIDDTTLLVTELIANVVLARRDHSPAGGGDVRSRWRLTHLPRSVTRWTHQQ